MDRQRGIWRPAGSWAALSIKTTFTGEGQQPPYADGVGPDGLLRYKYEGHSPDLWTNVALRRAMSDRVPVVWFIGIGPGRFVAVAPVWLIGEERQHSQFVLAVEAGQRGLYRPGEHDEDVRRYAERISKSRLHEHMFRARVMLAYDTRCAVCRLRYPELIDAAHLAVDDNVGEPLAAHGMALCKIHHAAFDRNILGVRPDLVIQVRRDVLQDADGPMLRYGLQALQGTPLAVVPTRLKDRRDRERLALKWAQFERAS